MAGTCLAGEQIEASIVLATLNATGKSCAFSLQSSYRFKVSIEEADHLLKLLLTVLFHEEDLAIVKLLTIYTATVPFAVIV